MNLKGMIISEFQKTVGKAIERFAKKENTAPDNIQIALGLNQDGTPKFTLYREYKPVKPLTVLELLGVKIDFLGKEGMINQFLPVILIKVAASKGIPNQDMRLLCIRKADKLILFLMNGTNHVGQVQLEEIIEDADLIPA
jgi:hypothetical protein